MLTEGDKDRITTEEIFREEVRRDMEMARPPLSKKKKLWTVLNSSFALWFMSTIIVGVISFSYAAWDKSGEEKRRSDEESRTVEREKTLATRKLDTEISSRLYYFSQLLDIEETGISVTPLLVLNNPSIAEYPINVFPEFEKRTLQSLLWELVQVVPESEKDEIKNAYEQAKTLSSLSLLEQHMKAGNARVEEKTSVAFTSHGVADLLSKSERYANFNLERWGKPLAMIYQSDHSNKLKEELYEILKRRPPFLPSSVIVDLSRKNNRLNKSPKSNVRK